jgi:hypothetical protein
VVGFLPDTSLAVLHQVTMTALKLASGLQTSRSEDEPPLPCDNAHHQGPALLLLFSSNPMETPHLI